MSNRDRNPRLRDINKVWQTPPPNLRLSPGEIHVWRASLDWSPAGIQSIQKILSDEELNRGQAFYFPRDSQRFTVARGILRLILGQYIGLDAKLLEFVSGRYGKPALFPKFGADSLQFNLSHSHDLALIAVAENRSLGVDIEYVKPNVERLQLADRFFSPREVAILRSLPEGLQEEAFYLCWTRKEAYLKATGLGLSLPLDQFDVALAPGESIAMLRNDWDPGEVDRWVFYSLPAEPAYALALVAAIPPAEVRYWQWTEGMWDSRGGS